MEYALKWLLAVLIVALVGSFFVSGHNSDSGFWDAPSNYRLNGYKYLNREL